MGISEVSVKREREVSTEVTAESATKTDLQETEPKQSSQHATRSESHTQTVEENDYTL